jgi:hypothetical protein
MQKEGFGSYWGNPPPETTHPPVIAPLERMPFRLLVFAFKRLTI